MSLIRKIGAMIGVMFAATLLTIAALFSGWRLKRVSTADPDWVFALLVVAALVIGCVMFVLRFYLPGH